MTDLPSFSGNAMLSELLGSVSSEIAPHDQMHQQGAEDHYFGTGYSAISGILNAVNARSSYLSNNHEINDILDFGCGCGRVARFLRAAFPKATLWVTDLRVADMNWCVDRLNCTALPGPPVAEAYDLIWLGSVFTHLPLLAAERLLGELLLCLKPNGLLAFTSHGRNSYVRLRTLDWNNVGSRTWLHYNLSKDKVESLVEGYERERYGYVDYPHATGYGISLVHPFWYSDRALTSGQFTHVYFQERAYDDHQDLTAFMKRSISAQHSTKFMDLISQNRDSLRK